MPTAVQTITEIKPIRYHSGFNKLRGGYYTPEIITDFITNWAVRSPAAKCLEPSCGDGAFLASLSRRYANLGASPEQIHGNILGVELYPEEAEKAGKYGPAVMKGDFFSLYQNHIQHRRSFDAVTGNPPFIRYQSFQEEYRKRAFSMVEEIGIKLNRLTNIWIPFLILSFECLSENGRLGMVIPAELFQVDYAAETREYLSKKFDYLLVLTFKKLLFDDAQQEVILLLGEVSSHKKGIEVCELDRAEDLRTFQPCHGQEVKALDSSRDKWVKYYLSGREIDLLKKVETLEGVAPTTELFDTNVGLVTGQNSFFLLGSDAKERYSLKNAVQPIIGRAEQLKGIQLNEQDLSTLADRGKKVFLFAPEDVEKSTLPASQRTYIEYGERQGVHKGFKCRNRKRWYIVPQSWPPEAFLLRQIHRYPRLVLNRTNATNTDTLHKVRFRPGVSGENTASAFLNSFTLAQCEVTGRSYGGGVMTFEPGEIRKLRVPMKNAQQIDFQKVDGLIRENQWGEALDYVDSIVLVDGQGLSKSDILSLRGIWRKLSDRRLGRREGTSVSQQT